MENFERKDMGRNFRIPSFLSDGIVMTFRAN